MVNIKVRVRNLIEKYGTRDPETLANELGIVIKRYLNFIRSIITCKNLLEVYFD